MKFVFLIFLITIFTSKLILQNGTIDLTITGIENTKGVVEIGLYNSKSNFPVYGKEFRGIKIKPTKTGSLKYTFPSLPDGTYAIAVWHDENQNHQIDKNFFGVPTEKYGFSLNKYGTLSPPDFDVVSFKITNGSIVKLTINLE